MKDLEVYLGEFRVLRGKQLQSQEIWTYQRLYKTVVSSHHDAIMTIGAKESRGQMSGFHANNNSG